MGKPKAPPAPDYTGAAAAQGAANVDAARATAKLSNPNINNPYGSQTVTYDGDVPTVTQTLSPTQQLLFDKNQSTQLGLSDLAHQGLGNVSSVLGSPFDTSKVASAPINPGTTAQAAIMSRLQPQIDRSRQQLQTQLSNQGIMQGSEAYKNAMDDQGRSENDLLTQAAVQGINLDTQAHQQGLQEQSFLRDMPLNEINSLMSSSQVQMPNFQGYQGAQVGAAPLFQAAGAAGDYAGDLYNAKAGMYGNQMNGLFGLGSAGLMAMLSDRRLKTNIVKIGESAGINIYAFDYIGSNNHQIGVMADEVEHIPGAVHNVNGVKMVDYSRVC